MRTKRKRATRKPPPKKPSPPPAQNEEACSNFVAYNTNPISVQNASIPVEVEPCDSPGPSSPSSDSDESYKLGGSSSGDSVFHRRPRISATTRGKSSQLSKRTGGGNPNSASILPSSSRQQISLCTPHHDSRHFTEELKTALAVVRKVMQMEEAQPFNVPVDPVALGRHDYYEIIHTPMDFGTISRNLEGGIKYKNSSDVYNDIEHIWVNCLKLYKKGEYIVYLMKLVKKRFMKYWTAAGMNSRQSKQSKVGQSHFQPLVESAERHYQHVPRGPVGHMAGGNPTEIQPPHTHLNSKQPSSQQMPQQRINLFEPSRLQGVADNGHSHKQSHAGTRTCGEQLHCNSLDPMFVEASQIAPQPSHASSHYLKEQSQLQPSCIQPQSSRVQANVEIENSHLLLAGSAMRGIDCALRYALGPTTDQSSQENRYGGRPSESPPDHTPESDGLYDPARESRSWKDIKKTKKKVRGFTRCIFLKNLEDGERIYVPINDLGQPVGDEARKLTTYLGTIARNGHMAPLTYTTWSLVPKTFKENLWQLVQTKFDIDFSCKRWVMQSIRDKWRNWKCYLKVTYFDTHETDEERLKACDRRVLPEQWAYLVSYWNSEKAKKHSAANKASCRLRKMQHATGGKSFARIREELKQKRPDGKEPTRAELYILTHTRKDGQPVNEAVAATIEKLREQTLRKQSTGECRDDENDTYCEVMGNRNDRLRAYAPGAEPAELWSMKPSHHELIKMNKKVSMMSDKIEALEQKYASIETQLALMNSNFQKFVEKMGGQTEELVDVADELQDA